MTSVDIDVAVVGRVPAAVRYRFVEIGVGLNEVSRSFEIEAVEKSEQDGQRRWTPFPAN